MKTTIIRISLALTIIASLAIGALNIIRVREKITGLQTNLQAQTDARQRAENDLHKTRAKLKNTTAALAETKSALEVTTAEKQKAQTDLAAQTSRATRLESELQATRIELGKVSDELAPFLTAKLSAAEVLRASKEIKRLQTELAAAADEIRTLKTTIASIEHRNDDHVPLPANLTGKVLVTDPKWQFVVLNVGRTDGLIERGELLVSRAGKLVGKVKVSRVERDRAIGNILPGSGPGDVLEGDQVIPAYPES